MIDCNTVAHFKITKTANANQVRQTEACHVSPTVSNGDVPEGDVGAINKSDASTGVFSTFDDHCRLTDSLMKALLHSPSFKYSIRLVKFTSPLVSEDPIKMNRFHKTLGVSCTL